MERLCNVERSEVGVSVGTLFVDEELLVDTGSVTDKVELLADDVTGGSAAVVVSVAVGLELVWLDKLVEVEVEVVVTSFAPQTPFFTGAPSDDFK